MADASPREFYKALDAAKLKYAASSWGGFNLFGDIRSIEELSRIRHEAGIVLSRVCNERDVMLNALRVAYETIDGHCQDCRQALATIDAAIAMHARPALLPNRCETEGK